MPGFLLHLQGPMQSYDDTGFGQIRKAGEFPSRAAVLGIVAAALGIPRADDRLVALHEAFRVHVAMARPGRVRKDYHTVETDAARPKTLTWRDYHYDTHFVALLESPDAGAVNQAVAALKAPVYTTFLGRRSCPPALPLWPWQPTTDAVLGALADASATGRLRRLGVGPRHQLEDFSDRELHWASKPPGRLVCFLDDHFERSAPALRVPGGARYAWSELTHGTRRDRLVAPKRAYVNRPYTRLTLLWPAHTDPSDEQQAYFDAAS